MRIVSALLRGTAILGIGILAAQPLIIHGLPVGHDTYYHVQRTASLARALEQGILYPRWSADLAYGFGYPVFHYYAPLSYYAPALLTTLGVSAVQAVTLLAIAASLLQALGAWLWLRSLFEDEVAAFGGSVAYTLSPYVVDNALGRGALAEHFALAAAPFAFWSLTLLGKTKQVLWFGIATLLVTATLLSHNVSALMLTIVAAAYVAFLSLHYRNPLVWLALFYGIGVSLFFWLPVLAEREFVQISRLYSAGWANFRDHFLPLETHFALPEPIDLRLVAFQPRQAALNTPLTGLAVAGAIVAVVRLRLQDDKRAWLLLGSLAGFVGALFMTNQASLPIWEAIDSLKFLQFPWRFYIIASVCLAPLAAGALTVFKPLLGRSSLALALFLATTLGFSAAYVFPRQIPREVVPADFELTPHAIARFEQRTSYIGTTTAGEYLPIGVEERPPFTLSPFADPRTPFATANRLARELSSPLIKVLAERYTPYRYELQLATPSTATLVFKTFDFPGWEVYVNGNVAQKSTHFPYGLLQTELPPGEHEVIVAFGNTPIRTLGEAFSFLSLLAFSTTTAFWHRLARSAHALTTHPEKPKLRWEILALAALSTFAAKTFWVDRTENPFAYTRFDGTNVRDEDVTLQKQFGEGLVLIGADIGPVRQDKILVHLYWRVAQPIEQELSSSLQLVDEQGFLVGQSDNQHPGNYPVPYWRPGYYARDSHLIHIFPGTPPGTYTLYARVYPYGQPDKLLRTLGSNESAVKIAQVTLPTLSWNKPLEKLAAEHYRQPEPQEALALIAYNQHRDQARPGEQLPLTFFWRAQRSLCCALTATLTLEDVLGKVAAMFSFPPVMGYPTDRWQVGEVWRGNHLLRLPRTLESGTYQLALRYGDSRVLLSEPLEVSAPQRLFSPPQEGLQVWHPFADAGALVAFSVPERASPGTTIIVRLTWRATTETDQAYKVFVHLLNAAGEYVTGHDSEPANWERPTTGWVVGEYVLDDHPITLPEQSDIQYTLRVGLYDPETGARVQTLQGDDGVTLPVVLTVSAP